MKKILCVLALVIGCNYGLKAQLQKGNVLVGADLTNLQFSLNKGGNFNVRIDPKAAWFVRDNLALGANVYFELITAKGAGTTVNYGVGPLARYYLGGGSDLNVLRHSRLFVEANAGIQGYNPAVGDNTNGFGFGAGPGLAYFITPNIGLEGLVKFNDIIGFGSAISSSNLNLQFGFQIYLPGRQLKKAATNTQ